MKWLSMVLLCLVTAGCTSTSASNFFGSNDPCTIGAGVHAAFVTVAADRVSAQAERAERATYAGFVAACNSGDVTKPTLQQLLNAYSAAVEEYKRG